MGDSHNFFIGDLGFHKAVNPERPYERATAPFRKEQFDAAPTVGDQSLSGWWTRGQLSFHKGAGVEYYEVLSGDEILDRYKDSLGVEVGEPGEVTLAPALADLAFDASKAVPGTLSGGEGLFALTPTGVEFYNGATTTAMSTSDGGVASDITTDGRYYYILNGNKIERQSSAALARTNYVTDPSIETGISAWTSWVGGASPVTMVHSSAKAKYGTKSLEVTGASGGDPGVQATFSGLTTGVSYRISVWVLVPSSAPVNDISLHILNTGTDTTKTVTKDVWTRFDGYWTAGAAPLQVAVAQATFPVAGDKFYLDGVMITEAPFDGDFFDGNNGGTWTGTANASTSTFASSVPGSSNLLWEHEQGAVNWQGIWWAKGRLWAVDDAGRWYALPATGGTVLTDDTFWTSRRIEGSWTLAEGPGAVYVGHESEIFGIALDTEGAVPVVDTPAVVATIPKNETIAHLDHYLGHLLIASDAGIRVGLTGQSGELVYGPLVIDGDFSSVNMAGKRDTRLYVVGVPEGHSTSTVCAIDLGAQIADLLPAWSPYQAVGSTTSTQSGAALSSDGVLYAWAAGKLYGAGTALSSSGYLYTGLHRFGTLEAKHFSGVRIRTAGDSGSIKVYSVLPSGQESLLDTIDVAAATGTEVALVLDGPVEAVGLKFELLPDPLNATSGPTLLGYQIKALPSPRRQRLIRVPLMMFDVERGPSGRSVGAEKSAWTRLQALELVEETDALVAFEDKDTGETGTAYMEAVELFVQSGPKGNSRSNGFGGIVMVTLRKV